jgi:ATP-binding cassette subfamily C (CFTR/MRP) protein 1
MVYVLGAKFPMFDGQTAPSFSVWLSKWADHAANQTSSERDLYLGVYGGLGAAQVVSIVFGALFMYFSTLGGAQRLHNKMLSNMLKAPMSFFDTTPQGRILNRFGKVFFAFSPQLKPTTVGNIICYELYFSFKRTWMCLTRRCQ